MQALKKNGVDYCIRQLKLGVEYFSKTTMGDYSEIEDLFDEITGYERCENDETLSHDDVSNWMQSEFNDSTDEDDDELDGYDSDPTPEQNLSTLN